MSFVSVGLFSFLYLVSFYVWPTYNHPLTSVAPIVDTIPDYSTEPPSQVNVEVITCRTFRIEHGLLITHRSWWFYAAPRFEFGTDPELGFEVPFDRQLMCYSGEIGSNYGQSRHLSIPLWYFAVPLFAWAGFYVLPPVFQAAVRAAQRPRWKPLLNGTYVLLLVGAVGAPTFLFAVWLFDSIGSTVGGDHYLYLGGSNEMRGLTLLLSFVLGTTLLAIGSIHAHMKRYVRQFNTAI